MVLLTLCIGIGLFFWVFSLVFHGINSHHGLYLPYCAYFFVSTCLGIIFPKGKVPLGIFLAAPAIGFSIILFLTVAYKKDRNEAYPWLAVAALITTVCMVGIVFGTKLNKIILFCNHTNEKRNPKG